MELREVEQNLHDAIEAFTRATGDPTHMVTDYITIAASVDMASDDPSTTFTIHSPGAPHAAHGLLHVARRWLDGESGEDIDE